MDMYFWTKVMCVSIVFMQDSSVTATALVYGTAGSDVELLCTVYAIDTSVTWLGPPNDTVYAFGNDVANFTDTLPFIVVTVYNNSYSTLKISELSTEKQGNYRCLWRHSVETFEIRIKKNPSNMTVVNATDQGMIYGVEGTDLSLECTVNRGEPGGNITWTDDDHAYATDGPEHVYYRFKSGRSHHSQVFKCTSYNSEGDEVESRNITLFIFYKPVVTTFAQPSQVVWEGHDLKLKCKHDGNDPDATTEWTWNDTKRPVNVNILTFANVKRQEAGEYTCEVHTKGGYGVSSIEIVIQYPPNVTIIERQHDNNTYVLGCIANGVPNKYFYSEWEHKTEWSNHIRFVEGSQDGHLTIQNDPSNVYGYFQNSGIYVCNVSNNISDSRGSKHQTATINLKLKGRPIFLPGNKQTQHAIYGRKGVIQLVLYSFPKYENVTMFSGKTSLLLQSDIKQENRIFEENEGPALVNINGSLVNVSAFRISVRINKITESHFTKHTINVTNSFGTAAFTVRLISAHRPEPPFNVSAKPDTNTILVSWNGGFNGGYPQTFVLQYKKIGVSLQNIWTVYVEMNDTRKTNYTTTIEGLEFDMQYIVCLFSYNAMNRSELRCTDPVKTDHAESTSTGLVYGLSSVVFGVVVTFVLVVLKHKYKEYRVVLSPIEPFAASNQMYSSFSRPHAGFLMDQNVCFDESSVLDRDFFNRKDKDRYGKKVENRTNHIFKNEYHHYQDKDGSELNYVEISFDKVQKGRKYYIHGNDNRTPYAEIDLNIKADPLPESDTESGDEEDIYRK